MGLRERMTDRTAKDINREFAGRFRLWLNAQHYAASTQNSYCRAVLRLCHHIGNRALRGVTPMDIVDFLTKTLPPQWSDDHVTHQLGALRCFFDFLYLGGIVDSVAPRFLRARARVRKLPKMLTQAQVKRLIATTDNARDRALIEVFYSTGCRVGEVTAIRVEHIDFRKRCFRVAGKRKERVVYFGSATAKAIHTYLGPRKSGYLFQDIIPQQNGYITYYKKAWIGNWRDHRLNVGQGSKHTKWLGHPSKISYASAQGQIQQIPQRNRFGAS
jgi:integrase/recombinase XerD